jgi:ferredoxin
MPVIRFLRENRDVECCPGENLRDVALREGIGLYGLKGILGNCGGCGQCITCFVEIPEGCSPQSLSGRTTVEDQKLRRRPSTWRLACQALVERSLVVITRPQLGLANKEMLVASALASPLPAGPTSWPSPPAAALEADEGREQGGDEGAGMLPDPEGSAWADAAGSGGTTSDEGR